jgi:hypothetical protein
MFHGVRVMAQADHLARIVLNDCQVVHGFPLRFCDHAKLLHQLEPVHLSVTLHNSAVLEPENVIGFHGYTLTSGRNAKQCSLQCSLMCAAHRHAAGNLVALGQQVL